MQDTQERPDCRRCDASPLDLADNGAELDAVLNGLVRDEACLRQPMLELGAVVELTVGGVAVADMGAASEAYRTALQRVDCHITAHAKNFKRSEMTFVLRLPRTTRLDAVVTEVEQIPGGLRGTPDWSE